MEPNAETAVNAIDWREDALLSMPCALFSSLHQQRLIAGC